MKRYFCLAVALVAAFAIVPEAQMRVVPVDEEQGHIALGLVLRHLMNAGIYMMADAHPDDENNGLLVELNRGQGFRTTLATATRGNGGQNEIGPELYEPLAVLRTEELAALHRFDGAEQYFTRAIDFGYTIDMNETLAQWGKEEIVGDYVRLIRTIRPDVISTMSPTALGPGQHAHHAMSAVLSHEAYLASGDPTKYPEQIKEGLHAWQPKKFYYTLGGPGGGNPPAGVRACRIDLALYDTLLGKTFSEIGTEARSMHKCQGQAQLLALPGPSAATFQLAETVIPGQKEKDERSLFDGIDTSIAGIAKLAGRPPKDLVDGLAAMNTAVQAAQKKFESDNDGAALTPLLDGLHAVRVLRTLVRSMQIDDAARFEIDFRLRQKEREFQQATLIANGVRVEALADDGVVVPGQPVKVSVIVASHAQTPVTVKQVKFDGFEGDAQCTLTAAVAGGGGPGGGGAAARQVGPPISSLRNGQVGRCDPTLKIPADAKVTEPYWHRPPNGGRYVFDADAPFGLPFRPTPFYVQITLTFPAGDEVIDGLPVQYRYEGNIFSGEKRMDLLVVPPYSVTISPDVAMIPAAAVRVPAAPAPVKAAPAPKGTTAAKATPAPAPAPPPPVMASREIRVTVVNDTQGEAESTVTLDLPEGWTASPTEQPLKFTRQDESQTVRFDVRPAPDTAPGEFQVRAVVNAGPQKFDRGFEVIEYPHIRRRHIYEQSTAKLKILDVKTAPNLTVGYVIFPAQWDPKLGIHVT